MRILFVTSLLLTGAAAYAQDIPYSIESEGVATVDIAPTYAEFWLTASLTGASVAEAIYRAQRFEPLLRGQLDSLDLRPSDISFSGVSVPSIENRAARVSARLRFSAGLFSNAETGPAQFGILADRILDIAAALQAQATGPLLGVEDPVAVQQTAVQRALEKAYPAAKAAADIMNGQIVAVGKVNIQDVTWNDIEADPAVRPDIRRLTCTARLRVAYLYNPGL